MVYEWGWGYQPDEWVEDDWYDIYGNYHTVSELGGVRKDPMEVKEGEKEDIPF